MGFTQADRCEFLRSVYDAGADFAARKVVLDRIRDAALKQKTAGKTLTAASGAGVSSQFEQLIGHDASGVIALVHWARAYIAEDSIEDALALIPQHGVTLVRAQFAGLRG